MVFGRVKAVTAMVCAALISTPLIALADDGPITSQPYVDFYGIHKAHEQGYAGQGVTIALIDGIIDPSVPELEGADIEVVARCDISDPTIKKDSHPTAIASFLVSPAYGWVPKAKLIAYVTNTTDDDNPNNQNDAAGECAHFPEWSLADAIERKVDIISISLEPRRADPEWQTLIHEAAQQGIIVVLASGNSGKANAEANNAYVGSVSVGSHNADGQPSTFSTYGEGLTLMAIGEPFTIREADDNGRLTRVITNAQGTSFSTPMVAGALALGKSKWPQGNEQPNPPRHARYGYPLPQ